MVPNKLGRLEIKPTTTKTRDKTKVEKSAVKNQTEKEKKDNKN
jgi:hypothetical protein